MSTNRFIFQTWRRTITTENNERRWRQSEKPAEALLFTVHIGEQVYARKCVTTTTSTGWPFEKQTLVTLFLHHHYYCDFVSLTNLLELSLTSSRRNPNKVRTLWRRCWKRRTNHPSKQSFPYFAFFVHDPVPRPSVRCCRTFLGNRGRANLVSIEVHAWHRRPCSNSSRSIRLIPANPDGPAFPYTCASPLEPAFEQLFSPTNAGNDWMLTFSQNSHHRQLRCYSWCLWVCAAVQVPIKVEELTCKLAVVCVWQSYGYSYGLAHRNDLRQRALKSYSARGSPVELVRFAKLG